MRIKGILFVLLCLLPVLNLGWAADAEEGVNPTPRQTYLTHKDSVLGFYNNLKFTLIDVRDWFQPIVDRKDLNVGPLPQGFRPFFEEVKSTIEGMVVVGQSWGLGLGHFSEQDAGLLARMQTQLEKTIQFKTDLAQIAQILRASSSPALGDYAQSKVTELTARNSDLQKVMASMSEYRNGLLPNISSLFGDETVVAHRSFNNIVLSQVKLTASNVPDRNYILISVVGEELAQMSPELKEMLREIVTLLQEKRMKKAARHLRRVIRHLRKERSTINGNVLINFILRSRFSFQNADENFEIIKARDLFDRIKSKREYITNLQKQWALCNATATACTVLERQNLDSEFRNHRASLVTLYSRFQEQYLKMFEMYESLQDLMPEYLYLHSLIKRQIEKSLLFIF
ncbi:MAG: hypothetical protein A2X86_20925 [Bdellovibrionales bacterium GWA2_49_15]|nr:MAG: hypothetical protein A2X86_20925 [Bdellovibrionales bacterium GWA2_49_15]HAZ14842.1 hypothetical protein [Bdellovibrionales bacterium]